MGERGRKRIRQQSEQQDSEHESNTEIDVIAVS
jgi:hypothetical protein